VVRDVDVIDGEPQPGAYMRGAEQEPTMVEPVDPASASEVRRTVHERRDVR
jgi:hypothetical protein